MTRRFAEGTSVPVEKTKAEMDKLLRQRNAERMAFAEENGRAMVLFEMNGRRIRFSMPLPSRSEERFRADGRGRELTGSQSYERWERECRSLWRGLHMAMKSRFVNVDNGIETFEDLVGSENDEHLLLHVRAAGRVVAAWGGLAAKSRNQRVRERPLQVVMMLSPLVDLHAFRLGVDGTPYHPLYLPLSTTSFLWRVRSTRP